MIAICAYCEKEFEAKGNYKGERRFCCRDHKDLFFQRNGKSLREFEESQMLRQKEKDNKIIKCVCCGKDFYSNYKHKLYCSRECYLAGNKVCGKGTCKQCGVEFVKTTPTKKFCSKECLNKHQTKKRKNLKIPKYRMCEVCNSEFEVTKKHLIYCSFECYEKGKRIKELLCKKKNKSRNQELGKEWRKNNKEKIKLSDKKPKRKISRLLRGRILRALKQTKKSMRTMELTGCSLDFLRDYLQQTAVKNGYFDFNIDEYNGKEYHIDHIIPCAAFNLQCSFHQKLCFNYTNLQILRSYENMMKSDKIIDECYEQQ